MISNVPEHLIGLLASLCASDAPVVGTAIADEVANDPANRGYAGKPVEEVLTLLASPYQMPNPEPQGVAARGEWATDELANALLQMPAPDGLGSMFTFMQRLAQSDSPLRVVAAEFLAAIGSLKALNLANPQVQAGFDAFVLGAVLTETQKLALTTVPDPAWSPVAEMPSRLEQIGFGKGSVATARDL